MPERQRLKIAWTEARLLKHMIAKARLLGVLLPRPFVAKNPFGKLP